jgi:hypothetical protein
MGIEGLPKLQKWNRIRLGGALGVSVRNIRESKDRDL